MRIYPNFTEAIAGVETRLRLQSYEVAGTRWQSTDVSTKPEMRMREVLNESFQVRLQTELPEYYRLDINPNLPWADDHFEERISGEPLNPGEQWKNWPWAHSADRARTAGGGRFSHTYMERYWPKYAGQATDNYLRKCGTESLALNPGIRYAYGDLNDVVNHLLGDPLTRQAYLPVWFPEDTGVVHGERVPCSLGYHWILRNGHLHTSYYIRSCDFVRHFRDDLYLSVRLTLWLISQLRERELIDPRLAGVALDIARKESVWQKVQPGLFTFHCVSMHMFLADWNQLAGVKR